MSHVAVVLALAGTTLLSEDAALVTAGLLTAVDDVPFVVAVLGCAAGIVAGDMLLWLLGRMGVGRLAARPSIARLLERFDRAAAARRLQGHLGVVVLASRGLPGTRLPLYVAAGTIGISPWRLAGWTVLSVAVWVPLVVAIVASVGAELTGTVRLWIATFPVATAIVVAGVGALTRRLATSETAMRGAVATLVRWTRWEFWPACLLYAPVVLWVLVLAIRYRGFDVVAAANPGMANGGLAGESKSDIQHTLPAEWAIPAVRLAPGPTRERARALDEAMAAHGWRFPVALKPDVGQRGDGVRRILDRPQAAHYLATVAEAVMAQPWSDAALEVGLYYVRMPDAAQGRVLSITDKRFAEVVGDGRSTLEQLIRRHPRCRLQAATFLARHAASRTEVPPRGQRVQLGVVGNHKQGTLFLDGRHLWTEALEQRVDAIARRTSGFFIGRFDVRYRDVEQLRAGEDLEIVELNGVSAEPTHIYDPNGSLLGAWRALCRHWSLVFAIGAANRRTGASSPSSGRLVWTACAHLAARPALPVAD